MDVVNKGLLDVGTEIRKPHKSNAGDTHVLLLGATGTIGQAVCHSLAKAGYRISCVVRANKSRPASWPAHVDVRVTDSVSKEALDTVAFSDNAYDVVISCLGSRSGSPEDARRIDFQANADAIHLASRSGVRQFILLSAICVQRPMLAFQYAKLEAEQALVNSGMCFCIVRPTAFFKSLSGQIGRIRKGKPFLMFGDGTLTSCKPISDNDLADYIVTCINNEERQNRILPIGGPGEAITPIAQAQTLFALLGKPARYRQMPVRVLDFIITLLSISGRVIPRLKAKAQLARIGRYYATESMLVWDDKTQQYRADLTPSHGSDTLFDYYQRVVTNKETVDLGEHSVFRD